MKNELLHLKEFYPALGEEGRDPLLECFLPANLSEMGWENMKRPTLLICPGGGYTMCSQREAEPVALPFMTAGFNVFVLTYSTAPHHFPVQLQEVAAALDLIARRAEEWHCDAGRLAIMGFSAGAHLAAHYANRYDLPEVRQLISESQPVKASILSYPVITADPDWSHGPSIERVSGSPSVDETVLAGFSCERMVTDATPPAFLWHTVTDGSVPVMNSLLYAEALARHHVPFELHVYPAGRHGLATVDPQTCFPEDLTGGAALASRWVSDACRWLHTILRQEENL